MINSKFLKTFSGPFIDWAMVPQGTFAEIEWDSKSARGAIYFENEDIYFCSNDPFLDGYSIHEKGDFKYSFYIGTRAEIDIVENGITELTSAVKLISLY